MNYLRTSHKVWVSFRDPKVSRLCRTRYGNIWSSTSFMSTELNIKLDDANSAHDLLEAARRSTLNGSQASYLLCQVAKLTSSKNLPVITEQEIHQIKGICRALDRHALQENTAPLYLFRACRALRIIGIDPGCYEVESLVRHLVWGIKKVNVSLLLSVLHFYLSVKNPTPAEKALLGECVENIEKRWAEVSLPRDIKLIYTHQKEFSPSFLNKFEARAIESIEEMGPEDLISMFVLLAKNGTRFIPLIRSIIYHLIKSKETFSPEDASKIIWAMCSLNMPDISTLDRLSSDIGSNIQDIKSEKLVSSILVGAGQLRWRCTDILDSLVEWIIANKGSKDCRLTCLNTLAHVNYLSPGVEEIIESLSEQELMQLIDDKLVCAVWDLCVFGRHTEKLLSNVLNKEIFISLKSQSTKLKLQNIASLAVAMGIIVPPELTQMLADLMMEKSQNTLNFSDSVVKALENILPAPKFLKRDVTLPINVYMDAVFYLDKQNNPLPVDQASRASKKVSVCVHHFKDICLSSNHMTGISSLGVQILKQNGYIVMNVPYFEFPRQDKTLGKVKYIQGLLNQITDTTVHC